MFVLAFSGSVQTAASPVEVLRAGLSADHAEDAVQDLPMKENRNETQKLHPELLLHLFS